MSKTLTINSSVEAFALELQHETRWQGGKFGGHSVNGIGALQRGMLPEPYHTAAADAVYAVYHYETPIAWKVQAGIWYVPDHFYSQTTSRLRNKIVAALESFGAVVEMI